MHKYLIICLLMITYCCSCVFLCQSQTSTKLKFSHLPPNYGLSNSIFEAAIQDHERVNWLGDKGMSYFGETKNNIIPVISDQPLNDEMLQNNLEEHLGELWISTNTGLYNYSIRAQSTRQFTLLDRIQGSEFSPFASLITKKGAPLFGGTSWFHSPDSQNIKTDQRSATLFLKDFQLFHKSQKTDVEKPSLKQQIGVENEINLNHNQSTFSIEFTSLNFIASPINQFAYMLEGLEEEWNYVRDSRKATYTNLQAGDYIFKIKTTTNHTVWNEIGQSIIITIEPPFWHRWWFKTFIVVFMLTVFIFNWIMYRSLEIRKLKNEQAYEIGEVQAPFYIDISHEFRTLLPQILVGLENIKNGEQTEKSFVLMQKNADRLFVLIKEVMNIQSSSLSHAQHKKDELFLYNLLQILEPQLDNSDLRVETLSKEMGMSQSKFYKKIKEITGHNISEFVRTVRLKKARQILLEEDISISQVMYRVGISSASYFTTSFKKEFGMTPSKYLKGLRGRNI